MIYPIILARNCDYTYSTLSYGNNLTFIKINCYVRCIKFHLVWSLALGDFRNVSIRLSNIGEESHYL